MNERVRSSGQLAQRVAIIGSGMCLGDITEENRCVEERLGWEAGQVLRRTGIARRFVSSTDANGLARSALSDALDDAGIAIQGVGLLVVANYVGDYVFPNLAIALADSLGGDQMQAIDVHANCAGFQAGLDIARNALLARRDLHYVAVVGVARQHPFLDPLNEETAPYFSDAASAVILGKTPGSGGLGPAVAHLSHGHYEAVRLRGGGGAHRRLDSANAFYEHRGMEVWKDTLQNIPIVIRSALDERGWRDDEVDLILFHQASLRLIEFLMHRLQRRMSDTLTNVQRIGNTADASLGTIIHEARSDPRWSQAGARILLVSVGAGFIYMASTYENPS